MSDATTNMPVSEGFWSQQASWWATVKDSKQKRLAEPGTRKEARWVARGARYLAGRRMPTGLIRVDPALSREVVSLAERIAPAMVRAFDARLGQVACNAVATWPVFTGLSKSLISLEYSQEGDRFIATLRSRAPYSLFIRSQPVRKLLVLPVEAVLGELASAAIEEVTRGG